MNRKILARNIRHRLANDFGSQWTGALDAAMDAMLLEEIDRFDIIQVLPKAEKPEKLEAEVPEAEEGPGPFCTASGKDIDPMAWPLRERGADEHSPDPKAGSYGDPYLKGIMDKD